jgi:type IV secretory pathway VirB6-like protein
MKRDFEYWERAYFDGWLGKLIAAVFIGIYLLIVIKIYIEPWAIETMCR